MSVVRVEFLRVGDVLCTDEVVKNIDFNSRRLMCKCWVTLESERTGEVRVAKWTPNTPILVRKTAANPSAVFPGQQRSSM